MTCRPSYAVTVTVTGYLFMAVLHSKNAPIFQALPLLFLLITGSRRYLIYSEADFEVFRPARATCCTDGVKFCMKEGTSSMPNFTPIGATVRE